MTLKQEVRELVEELPNDSHLLRDFRETVLLNRAIARGIEDVKAGRVYSVDEVRAKLSALWPKKSSE